MAAPDKTAANRIYGRRVFAGIATGYLIHRNWSGTPITRQIMMLVLVTLTPSVRSY